MDRPKHVVFDLDGTLLDSDQALVDAFLALGVQREELSFGHAIAPECERLGISLDDYVGAYDTTAAQPFKGVEQMLAGLESFSICSNKHQQSGIAELERLAWSTDVALFADAFDGKPKRLGPVLEQLGASAHQVLFVGDTAHDAACAAEVGASFAWAGWNPRTKALRPDGLVLDQPSGVRGLLLSR